jgi:hypothetical protein
MSALRISVFAAAPAALTAAPAIVFRLRLAHETRIHALAMRVQVQIEARGRGYDEGERERLYELFGEPSLWTRTLGALTWAQTALMVPGFEGEAECELAVPCTYDLDVAAAKYLHGVREGAVPLRFLFTGTAFAVDGGVLHATPVAWDCEAAYRMPTRVWRDAMDRFFPGGGWIRLGQETLDRLLAVRGRGAHVSWDNTLDVLLASASAAKAALDVTGEPT